MKAKFIILLFAILFIGSVFATNYQCKEYPQDKIYNQFGGKVLRDVYGNIYAISDPFLHLSRLPTIQEKILNQPLISLIR